MKGLLLGGLLSQYRRQQGQLLQVAVHIGVVDHRTVVVDSPTGSIRYKGLSGRCNSFAAIALSGETPSSHSPNGWQA